MKQSKMNPPEPAEPNQWRSEPLRVGVPEAARMLGVSRARLYDHIKRGSLKSVKDGSRTLFTMVELRAFAARGDSAAAPSS
jgi:excisionase family DNA binding protein